MAGNKERARASNVTDEHRQEAHALNSIWEQKKPALKRVGLGSQEAFGLEYGIGNQGAVWQFLNGKTPLSLKAAVAFARGLGVQVADFSPRLAQQLFEQPSAADRPAGDGDQAAAEMVQVVRKYATAAEVSALADLVRRVALRHRVAIGPDSVYRVLDVVERMEHPSPSPEH